MNAQPSTYDRATVTHGGIEHRCKNLIHALRYAVEMVPTTERQQLRMICDRGQRLDWDEVKALYEQHRLGGYLFEPDVSRH